MKEIPTCVRKMLTIGTNLKKSTQTGGNSKKPKQKHTGKITKKKWKNGQNQDGSSIKTWMKNNGKLAKKGERPARKCQKK